MIGFPEKAPLSLLEERAEENRPWDVGRRLAAQRLGGRGDVGLIIISTVTNCMKNMFKLDYVCIQNDSKNETKIYSEPYVPL